MPSLRLGDMRGASSLAGDLSARMELESVRGESEFSPPGGPGGGGHQQQRPSTAAAHGSAAQFGEDVVEAFSR